jgi:hypothetical protein
MHFVSTMHHNFIKSLRAVTLLKQQRMKINMKSGGWLVKNYKKSILSEENKATVHDEVL